MTHPSVVGRDGAAGDAPTAYIFRGEGDVLCGGTDCEVQRDQREGAEGADIRPGDADLRDAAPHRGARGREHGVSRKSLNTIQGGRVGEYLRYSI